MTPLLLIFSFETFPKMYQPNVFIHEANILKDPTLLLLSFLMISGMVGARDGVSHVCIRALIKEILSSSCIIIREVDLECMS